MRTINRLVAFVGLTLLLMAFAQAQGLKDLEGTYTVESAAKGGVEIPDAERQKVTFSITAEELMMKTPDRTVTAKIKVDSTKSPMTIDLSPTDGPEKGKTFPGIYKIESGELVIAFNERGDRPTEFKAEGDIAVLRLKKQQAEKK